MTSVISLLINGEEFSDWLRADFSFSLDDGASTFQMTVSERWQGSFFRQWQAWRIPAGSPVQVLVSGELVLTGFVDVHEPTVNANDHTVSIGGRSATGDLVDCSIVHDGYSWSNMTPQAIASEICLPFGISVFGDLDLEPIRRFQVESGTTAWEAIRQLSEKTGALIVPRREGGLSFERASTQALPFELSCPSGITLRNDHTGRYSDWVTTGQMHGFDGDPVAAAQVTGEVQDTSITRYRPIVVDQQGETDGITAQQSADWRKARSIGDSLSATIEMPDFQNPDGDIWWPNQRIRVRYDPVGIDRELLISSVRFSIDSITGATCTLGLKHPASYEPKPQAVRAIRPRGQSTSDGVTGPFEDVDADISADPTNLVSVFDGIETPEGF